METLEVTLRQHTPLIHFQHYQEGATLRASEVKPRLDKFLIGNDAFDKWKRYLVGALHLSDEQMEMEAKTEDEIKRIKEYVGKREKTLEQKFKDGFRGLDYKLTILPSSKNPLYYDDNDDAMCMYFANQGTVEKKRGILYDDDVILRFTSQHSGLIKVIEQRFPVFLSQTNFGSRQTKGYGSFFIKDKENQLENADYSFIVSTNDVNVLFEQISDFYSVIRAGINNRGLYIKSALYKYLAEQNIQWDKKTIKQQFYTNDEKTEQRNKHLNAEILNFQGNTGNEHIYKELLGLSTNETWYKVSATLTNKHSLKREVDNDRIARFKSPVLFKPIKNGGQYVVYIYLSEIPTEMRNKDVKIIWDGNKNETFKTANDFSVIQYFNWIYAQRRNLITSLSNAATNRATERRNNINNCFTNLKKIKP